MRSASVYRMQALCKAIKYLFPGSSHSREKVLDWSPDLLLGHLLGNTRDILIVTTGAEGASVCCRSQEASERTAGHRPAPTARSMGPKAGGAAVEAAWWEMLLPSTSTPAATPADPSSPLPRRACSTLAQWPSLPSSMRPSQDPGTHRALCLEAHSPGEHPRVVSFCHSGLRLRATSSVKRPGAVMPPAMLSPGSQQSDLHYLCAHQWPCCPRDGRSKNRPPVGQ